MDRHDFKRHVPRLYELCERRNDLLISLEKTLLNYGEIISEKLDFFPEYTDHGKNHFWFVLSTASSLIPDDAWSVVTPEDGIALTFSILLHDLGMHLTIDNFLTLVDGSATNPYQPILTSSNFIVPEERDLPWNRLWSSFCSNLRKLDETEIHQIVGEDVDAFKRISIDDWSCKSCWTNAHKKCIGEFIRKHHGRIAHDIAVHGFPSKKRGETIYCIKDDVITHDIANLYGFIARSHSYSLAEIVDHLHHHTLVGTNRTYEEIHPVYLMGLLRIADYLHVTQERANNQKMKIKTISSPISCREWSFHKSITSIASDSPDPYCITISANPPNYSIFKAIKSWQNEIQQELDKTWRMFDLEYGRFDRLNSLGLSIRRVQSTLDLPETLNLSYYPVDAGIKLSRNDLLSLLSEKLYGQKPHIGIREIVQNSIDAITERKKRENNHVGQIDVSLVEKKRDGSIQRYLEISDNGMGMDIDVICNYFLRVGSSYRNSPQWKYGTHGSSSKGTGMRMGRFGIGVLASFLLGSEMIVSTRHIDAAENEGINFNVDLSNTTITLNKEHRADIGTTIKIALTAPTYKELYDIFNQFIQNVHCEILPFYFLDDPQIRLIIQKGNKKQSNIHQKHIPAFSEQPVPMKWRRLPLEGYDDIFWSPYSFFGLHEQHTIRNSTISNPLGFVNGMGIRVDWNLQSNELSLYSGKTHVVPHNICIYDNRAFLDISIDRTNLRKNVEIQQSLSNAIKHDFMAFMFVTFPSTPHFVDSHLFVCNPLQYTNGEIYIAKYLPTGGTFFCPISKNGIHLSLAGNESYSMFVLIADSIGAINYQYNTLHHVLQDSMYMLGIAVLPYIGTEKNIRMPPSLNAKNSDLTWINNDSWPIQKIALKYNSYFEKYYGLRIVDYGFSLFERYLPQIPPARLEKRTPSRIKKDKKTFLSFGMKNNAYKSSNKMHSLLDWCVKTQFPLLLCYEFTLMKANPAQGVFNRLCASVLSANGDYCVPFGENERKQFFNQLEQKNPMLYDYINCYEQEFTCLRNDEDVFYKK